MARGVMVALGLAALGVGAVWGSVGSGAHAAPLETKAGAAAGELQMKADELEIDLENRRAELRGNVELSRSDLVVRCPLVVVEYDESLEVARAKASGGVVAEAKGVRAESPAATIDLDSRTLSLDGGVRLTQKNAVVQAERATVHLETGRVVLYKVKGTLPLSPP